MTEEFNVKTIADARRKIGQINCEILGVRSALTELSEMIESQDREYGIAYLVKGLAEFLQLQHDDLDNLTHNEAFKKASSMKELKLLRAWIEGQIAEEEKQVEHLHGRDDPESINAVKMTQASVLAFGDTLEKIDELEVVA